MKKIFIVIFSIFSVSLAFSQSQIHWLTWEEAAIKMEKEPRKIMVDAYTDWCGWCKRMDATTMQDAGITQIINEKYYAVKLDAESKHDIVFKGRTYKFVPVPNQRGYHELAAELMGGKMSYPTLIFLDEKFGIIQPLAGYQDAKGLEPILSYFGSNAYLTVKWADYLPTYKSIVPRQ